MFLDGKRITLNKNQYSFCIANNICTAAKGMKIAPDAKLNDGLMDLLLFRSDKMMDLGKLFQKFYDGTHTQLDFVDYFQVSIALLTMMKMNQFLSCNIYQNFSDFFALLHSSLSIKITCLYC